MNNKLVVKLAGVGIFLFFTAYAQAQPVSGGQEQSPKVAEIKSFLQQYDPTDISTNNTEELKAALTKLKTMYGEVAGEESAIPATRKANLMKIYTNKDSDLMRYFAYSQMTTWDGEGVDTALGMDKKERIELMKQGLVDTDPRIRIWTVVLLNAYNQKFTMSEEEYEEYYGQKKNIDDLDKEVQVLFNTAKQDNPVIRRFLAYPEKFQGKENLDEREYYSEVLKDPDAGIRFITLSGILMNRLGASIVDLPIFSAVVEAANDQDVLIRLVSLVALSAENKFKDRESKIFSESLESFFKEIKEPDLLYYFSGRSVPIEAIPDKEVLTRIFINSSVVKRAILCSLLRKSIGQ